MRARIVLLALLVAFGGACTEGRPDATPTGAPGTVPPTIPCRPDGLISLGEAIPDCSFRSFDGSILELTSLRGTPAVLNFWAAWCTYCVKEMPDFQSVATELDGRVTIVGFDLLGVQGESEAAARSFAKARGVTYPLAFDDKGLLYAHFSVRQSLPTTVFVAADGTVTFRKFGPMTRDEFRDTIRGQLKV